MTWKNRAVTAHPELEAELANVRAAAPPPSDDPIYRYLRRVYRLRCKVGNSTELQRAIQSERAANFPRAATNYAGMIIQLTAPTISAKKKYKYAKVITYTLNKGIEPKHFVAFVKKQGGINKCGDLWRQKYGKKKPHRRARQQKKKS